MKKSFLALAAVMLCAGAFAQGKIQFATDSNHLVYYDSSVEGLSGQGVSSGNMPSDATLVADLYIGTASSSLTLYSTATFSASPGMINQLNVQTTSPSIVGGSTVYVVTQIRDTGGIAETTLASSDLSDPLTFMVGQGFSYIGFSQEFTFTLGGGATFPAMYTSPDWQAGTFDLSASAGPGAKGAIAVMTIIPEPATFALAGLGMAGMLIFRRRHA